MINITNITRDHILPIRRTPETVCQSTRNDTIRCDFILSLLHEHNLNMRLRPTTHKGNCCGILSNSVPKHTHKHPSGVNDVSYMEFIFNTLIAGIEKRQLTLLLNQIQIQIAKHGTRIGFFTIYSFARPHIFSSHSAIATAFQMCTSKMSLLEFHTH